MDGAIASVVILPDELSAPASPSANKRRQSSVSEQNEKRPRLNSDAASQNSEGRVKPALLVRRERGRERRLFGAALGALSQNSATVAQKRRSEIEKRQLARRQQKVNGSEQKKAEYVAKRKEQRWREQKRFELASMQTRHENLRSVARFLQTKTEPCLYYKPWETTSSEDDCIQHQITEAEDIIDREVEEYNLRQRKYTTGKRDIAGEDGHTAEKLNQGKDNNGDTPQYPSTVNDGTNGSTHSPKDLVMGDDLASDPGSELLRNSHTAESVQMSYAPGLEPVSDDPSKDDDDDNGEDVVEEAAEDTVIY